jgi:hypothetical protein
MSTTDSTRRRGSARLHTRGKGAGSSGTNLRTSTTTGQKEHRARGVCPETRFADSLPSLAASPPSRHHAERPGALLRSFVKHTVFLLVGA